MIRLPGGTEVLKPLNSTGAVSSPYNEHRPHRALHLLPPNGRDPTPFNTPARIHRRDLLGGLIHEYEAA
jgi:hypothetical protein